MTKNKFLSSSNSQALCVPLSLLCN